MQLCEHKRYNTQLCKCCNAALWTQTGTKHNTQLCKCCKAALWTQTGTTHNTQLCKCCKAALWTQTGTTHNTPLYAVRLIKVQPTANCMQHSASGESNSSTDIQQIWNGKVHCRVHNSPALLHILNTTNPTKFNSPSIHLTSILILPSHLPLRPSISFLPSCCPPKIYNFIPNMFQVANICLTE